MTKIEWRYSWQRLIKHNEWWQPNIFVSHNIDVEKDDKNIGSFDKHLESIETNDWSSFYALIFQLKTNLSQRRRRRRSVFSSLFSYSSDDEIKTFWFPSYTNEPDSMLMIVMASELLLLLLLPCHCLGENVKWNSSWDMPSIELLRVFFSSSSSSFFCVLSAGRRRWSSSLCVTPFVRSKSIHIRVDAQIWRWREKQGQSFLLFLSSISFVRSFVLNKEKYRRTGLVELSALRRRKETSMGNDD